MTTNNIIESNNQRLYNDGMLAHVRNRGWKGQIKISPEALGYTKEEWSAIEVYTLGRMYIFPKSRLKLISDIGMRCYMRFKKKAFAFPLGGHFMTMASLRDFTPHFERLQEGFNEQVKLLLSEFDEQKEIHLAKLQEAAAQAWTRLNGNAKGTQMQFVENFMDRVMAAYPTREKVERSFSLTLHLYKIAPPDVGSLQSVDTEARFLQEEVMERNRRAIDDFLNDEVIPTLRANVKRIVERVRRKIASRDTIRKDTFDSMRSCISEFREMNFVGDSVVDNMLTDIERRYLSGNHKDVTGSVKDELDKALGAISEKIDSAGDSGVASITKAYKKRKIVVNK